MQQINPSLNLLMNMAKIQAVVSRRFDKLAVHGISFTDFMVLYLLQQAPGEQLRRIELADMIGLTASGITRLLLPMEKIGLVAREASERDARVAYAKLTPAGRRIFEEARKSADAIALEIVPSTYTKKKTRVADLFKLLGGNIS